MFNRERAKKLRKILLPVLVAGVVVSQVAPAAGTGLAARAETGDEQTDDAQTEAVQETPVVEETVEETVVFTSSVGSAETVVETGAADSGVSGEETSGGTSDDTQTGETTDESDQTGDTTETGTDENTGSNDESGNVSTDDTTSGEDQSAQADDTAADSADDAAADTTADTADDTANADTAETVTAEDLTATTEDAEAADAEEPATIADAVAAVEESAQAQHDALAEETLPADLTLTPEGGADRYGQDTTWYPAPSGEIVPSPVLYHGFRFWTVAKDYAFATQDLNITEEMTDSARVIGTLEKDNLCYILKEEDGWYYVESGTVRGFVPADQLLTGEDAQEIYDDYQEVVVAWNEQFDIEADIENVVGMAHEIIPKEENEAYDYFRATVYQTVVEKDYALPAGDKINVREGKSADSRVVGILPEDAIAYVIADKDEDWVYIESGDVRGFVESSWLIMSDADDAADEAAASILTKDEDDYATATEVVKPEDNAALYYTITSTKSGVPDGMLRNSILQYAAQFIGNPYVWGGTSLLNGADCSGFVQSIFAQYGYNLPRTAAEQSQVGTQIAVEDAQPGDLIFYGNGSGVYHVVIYAGDGQTIEAKSSKYGIVASTVSTTSAVWAVRVIEEQSAVRYEIPDGLGSVHSYMGWQKVTNPRTQQWAFREAAGMTFDPEGFALVDNRYVIACTSTFGNIGDYVDFYQEDGTVIPCIIGDFKNQNDAGCNAYGHLNGDCIVEFVVDMNSWYTTNHANPGTASCHPEWNQNIVRAENVGSFYD